MKLAENGAEDGETAEDVGWNYCITEDFYIQCSLNLVCKDLETRNYKASIKRTCKETIEDDSPSLASSKQCVLSQCEVYIVTRCPRS